MASEVSALIQSILADNLTNMSSKNPNTPSRHVRKEGWTEVFGNLSANKGKGSSTSTPASTSTSTSTNTNTNTNHDPSNIQIIQYRMSWTTQLLLRIYSIPHQVINTPYLSNQSTGAHPQYRNLSSRLLIGNHDILPYLNQDLKVNRGLLVSDTQRSEAHCLSSLLDQLDFILKGLRYGDTDAWDNIYKHQCIRGSTLHTSNSTSFSKNAHDHGEKVSKWNGFAWFQAWAERAVCLKEVKFSLGSGASSRFSNVDINANVNASNANANDATTHKRTANEIDSNHLVQLAQKGYAALDSKLKLGDGTLLGTESLTLEDIRLFGHLAEALCDVNLVTVLAGAEMKNVIVFFQSVYQKYFGKDYLIESIAENENENASSNDEKFAWIRANDRVNALNQFNRVPMNGSFKVHSSSNGDSRYKDAIEIMQTVALHCHDLQEVLKDMAMKRKEEDASLAKDSSGSKSGSLLHKWRMGGDLNMKSNKDDSDDDDDDADDADDIMKKNRNHMKKMMRQAKKNDEMWISGVVCATVVGLLAITNAAS
jgi:hypothetical protein